MSDQRKSANEFADLPIVQAHLSAAATMRGEQARINFLENTDVYLRFSSLPLESPLEVMFWIWWTACEQGFNYYPHTQVHLEPQIEVQAGEDVFRLDFVVSCVELAWVPAFKAGLMQWPKIGVEVDGHAFHERTPEQVAHRDRRDRLLMQEGWQIFHYSWAEFTARPRECVEEVYDLAASAVLELYRQYSQDIPPEFRGEVLEKA